jgi:hypothetical protein
MFWYKLYFYRTTFSRSLKSNLCICVNFYKYLKTDIPLSSSIHTLFFFITQYVNRTLNINFYPQLPIFLRDLGRLFSKWTAEC